MTELQQWILTNKKKGVEIMKFCPECGSKVEGLKFCPECGNKLAEMQQTVTTVGAAEPQTNEEHTVLEFSTYMFGLEGKKKNIIGNIDLSLPQYNYTLTNERLLINKKGYVSAKKEEIELYKIKDVSVKQGIKDKLLGIGNIELISVDESTPLILIRQIQNPENIKETIRSTIKTAKDSMNILYNQKI